MSEFLDEVLNEVNALRAEKGLGPLSELPRGVRGTVDACPLARALGTEVVMDPDWGPRLNDENRTYLEDPLDDFVERFDNGELPELVESS